MSAPQQPGSSTTTIIQTAVNENTDKRDVGAFLKRQFQQSLAFGTLIVLIIFFSIASPNFFTFSNIATVLLSTAVIGILALGIVALTVVLLIRSALKKKRAGTGCASGGCGCPTADFNCPPGFPGGFAGRRPAAWLPVISTATTLHK